MRIKKKYVLLESNLLDTLSEFSPQEKRLLWVLNKEYGPHDYRTFNIWNSAAWLIELFDIPYELAYDLCETYYTHGDILFGETKSYRTPQNRSEIFFRHIDSLLTTFKDKVTGEGDDEKTGTIEVGFDEDDYGKYESDILERDVHLWTNYAGFNLYIPFKVNEVGEWSNNRRFYSEETNPRLIMVTVRFSEITLPTKPDDNSYGYKGDPDKIHINVKIKIGDDDKGSEISNFMDYDIPTPKSITKDSGTKVFEMVFDDVMKKIKKTKFNLPSGTTPLDLTKNLED
jgi:hypothetical protein